MLRLEKESGRMARKGVFGDDGASFQQHPLQ